MTEAVALVRVELSEPSSPTDAPPDETALRRRTRYAAGIEYLACTLGAAQPLSWEGDAVTLVLGGRRAVDLPEAAYSAAQEIWQRTRIELGVGARIAVHVTVVAHGSNAGACQADEIRALLDLARPGMIVMTEDVALGLSAATRQDLAPLGLVIGAPAYAFPKEEAQLAAASALPDDEALWRALRAYIRSHEIRLLRYPGLRLGQRPPRLDVREVFVEPSLEILSNREGRKGRRQAKSEKSCSAPLAGGARGARLQDVLRERPRLDILGDPGTGKSTLLRWIAVIAAGGRFACATELGIPRRLLPVLVSLGRLAAMRGNMDERDPASLLARYLADRGLGDEARVAAAVTHALEAGQCLLLLDGLDEANAEDRAALRRWIEALSNAYPEARLIVTSRIVGYPGLVLKDGADAYLQPFGEAQVECAVRTLMAAVVRWDSGDPASAAGSGADALLEAIRATPRLQSLAGNPFALSTLALIHWAEGKLPRHRVQAYEVFAGVLCETWGEARRVVAGEEPAAIINYREEALPILGQLALTLHENFPDGLAPEAFIRDAVARALERHRGLAAGEGEHAAQEFLRRAAEDVQILAERGPGVWGFLHLTFQEFFAAAGLHAGERFEEVALARLFDPRWEEVIRLGVGYLVLVQRRPVAARRFVERVLAWREPAPNGWITAVLRPQIPMAALLAAEAGDALPGPLLTRIAGDVAEWLVDPPSWEASLRYLEELGPTDFFALVADALVSRVEAGELLSHRGDYRLRVSLALEVVARHAPRAVERLLRSDVIEARAIAIARLIQYAEDFKPYVRWALDGQPEEVRRAALGVLCDRHDRVDARELLLAATWDEDAAVRSIAVIVLCSIEGMVPETTTRLEELARSDSDLEVRATAAEALVWELGRDEDIALAKDLLKAPAPRFHRMNPLPEALAHRGQGRWLEQQWLSAMGSGDAEARVSAVDSLAVSRSRRARQAILDGTEDASAPVRAASIHALVGIEHADRDLREGMERRVRAALADPAPEVRQAAMRASVAGWLEGAALQKALATARQDTDPGVRLEALDASVAKLPDEDGEDLLLRALDDPDKDVVVHVAWMLAERRMKKAVPRLVELAARLPHVRGALWQMAM